MKKIIMNKLKIVSQIACLLFVGLLLFQNAVAQSNRDRTLIREAQRITKDNFPTFTVTEKGARVYSDGKPNFRMLNAIDEGLNNLFIVARKNNLRNRLNYSDYTIFIGRPDRTRDSSKNYSPDIAVGAGQYAGSEYDQGGYIYAAGMVLSFKPGAFIIAEHTKDFGRVSDVVRFEGEHIVLYNNDHNWFNRTADHSNGGGHPILK